MPVTEQADVARLLFSEASHPHCVGFSLLQRFCQRPKSGDGVKAHSPRQGQGLQDAEDERQSLLVPLKGKQYGGRRVRDKRQTQRGSGKLKCTYPKDRTQGECKTQLERERKKYLLNTATTWRKNLGTFIILGKFTAPIKLQRSACEHPVTTRVLHVVALTPPQCPCTAEELKPQ